MAMQVAQPKKSDAISKVLTIGGGIIGGIYGGPVGAAAGAQVGGMAGNMLSANNQGPENVESSAMSRRMGGGGGGQMQQVGDPYKALEEANMALASQSPEVQQQYAPAIKAALFKARRDQGVV